jgi:tyrosine-protein phosphatase YwqE
MLSFFNRPKTLTVVDIHSHLIPSLDDGATDIDNAIELINGLSLLGYRKLITTPHVSDIFKNSKKDILANYSLLKEELIKRDIKIDIEIGAEYYIDDYFRELLDTQKLLSFGDKNYLLFEFSYFTAPWDIEELIYDMILKGYTPILAHPERYIYWHNSFHRYTELKEMGVFFQLNLNSLNGYYNNNIRDCSEKLIKNSYINFVGSDTHNIKHIENLKKTLSLSIYKKMFKYSNILNNTLN